MMSFPWLTVSLSLSVLMVAQIDASRHRSVRQIPSDQCQKPTFDYCSFIDCGYGQCQKDTNVDCFKCKCNVGHTGKYCDTLISTTTSCNPACENGGTCVQTATNTFVCKCPADYTGSRCQTSIIATHPCATMPTTACRNGGTCTINGLSFLCSCTVGWTGPSCETMSSQVTTTTPAVVTTSSVSPILTTPGLGNCASRPCLNGGSCFNSGDGFVCFCGAQWSGPTCASANSVTTTLPAVLTTSSISPVVTTPRLGNCASRPCLNGGSCFNSGDGFVCFCGAQWSGPTCATPTSITTVTLQPATTPVLVPGNCASRPCLNGGSCFNSGDGFVCFCGTQWTGRTCATPKSLVTTTTASIPSNNNACSLSPCLNGGTCYPFDNSFVCVCTSGYTDNLCSTPQIVKTTTTSSTSTVKCANRPCRNGGSCFNDGDSYVCFCGTNSAYSGKNCDIPKATTVEGCPLNCAPGYCVMISSAQNAYACSCNGVLTPTKCSSQ